MSDAVVILFMLIAAATALVWAASALDVREDHGAYLLRDGSRIAQSVVDHDKWLAFQMRNEPGKRNLHVLTDERGFVRMFDSVEAAYGALGGKR